ncbi:hypothetical protein RBG61_02085 [Paludicola sp. MB14-C6]|uniref:hypothetical protein n=1 Tax=Paludihabitans sp. MB14-C6 TaxID=3070656 RepID=UPI0027DBEF62|nr:hypothetical protein [Paludicola sp. MB14-C6]WMJ23481.1 hypothetical protein RBG61_02085 [Paludicola sp. MB14-C6]
MKTKYVLIKDKRRYLLKRKVCSIVNGIVCVTSLTMTLGLVGSLEYDNIPFVNALIGLAICLFIFSATVAIYNNKISKPHPVIYLEEVDKLETGKVLKSNCN